MQSFFAFFLVTLTGVFSSTLVKKLHFPWVAALIIGGIIVGPNVLEVVEPGETLSFIAEMGLVFLMFMAGLEVKITDFNEDSNKGLFLLAFINGFIPFLVGMGIAYFYGFQTITMLLLGTVFVSSSIAVVVPTLEANGMLNLRLGKSVMTTSIIQDVASLLLLSIFLQELNPINRIPLVIFYPLLILSLVFLRSLIPKIQKYLNNFKSDGDVFQQELRTIFFILLGTVILFEVLGLHSIIGGFFAGLVLSDSVQDDVLKGKLKAISYGVFIPTFFIVVGMNTDISVLTDFNKNLALTILIVGSSIISKFVSGAVGAKLVGFNWDHSLFFGASSVPQLSTTLAVAYTAYEMNIISSEVNTALVSLSIISTVLGPILMRSFEKEYLTSRFSERLLHRVGRNKK